MTKLTVGVDVIEIGRVRAVLARHPGRFLARVFTAGEVTHCRGRIAELAARFAGKEAVMKALGTGVRGIGWREIEILPNRRGNPLVILHGNARARAETLGLSTIDISLSHSRDYAVASVAGLIAALPDWESAPRPGLLNPSSLETPAWAAWARDGAG